MEDKKTVYFLTKLTKVNIENTIIAIEIDCSTSNPELSVLHMSPFGTILRKNFVYVPIYENNITINPPSLKVEIFFEKIIQSEFSNHVLLYKIFLDGRVREVRMRAESNNKVMIECIDRFLRYLSENWRLARQYEFRDSISAHFTQQNSLFSYIDTILKFKTMRLKTAEYRQGKDNIFTDYMIIYLKDFKSSYFNHLIKDCFNFCSYDEVANSFKVHSTSYRAWSSSYEDHEVPDDFSYERIRLMEYCYKNYSNAELTKHLLFEIPLPK